MINVFHTRNGMSIIGQGGRIFVFTLPSLLAAILVRISLPGIATLPESIKFIRPIGYVLLVLGVALWASAVIQLIAGFSGGRLVTTGAYRIVRNPIYSSFTFFVLPAVAILTMTWVYLVPSVFLYFGVVIFIRKEEEQLTNTFGEAYRQYMALVDRMIPLKKP